MGNLNPKNRATSKKAVLRLAAARIRAARTVPEREGRVRDRGQGGQVGDFRSG